LSTRRNRAICCAIGRMAVGASCPGLAPTLSQTTTGPDPESASAATLRHCSAVSQE
jgi:hypothetical protein